MFKFYRIQTIDGDFNVISINKHLALIKSYNKYKRGRANTSFKKFKDRICSISVNK